LINYLVEEHQRWQQRILEVEAAIEACDRAAEQLVRTLHNAKMTLEDTVDAARQQIAKADAHGKCKVHARYGQNRLR
jgi:uncharacterized protein YukE